MQITTESIQAQIPYYLTQEAKGSLVKALNSFPRVDYYINRGYDEPLQGDGWDCLELIRFEDGDRKFVKGVLLSNSCDINPNIKRELPSKVTFVPVIRLSRYAELLANSGIGNEKIKNKIVAIKEQKVSTLFYLPQGAKLEDDYVALLDDVHTLPFVAFQAEKDQRKLFTLSQVGFYLFLLKLSVHFCRFHENVDRSQA